ncbi:spore cortex-lytic enzyme [Acutalibacter sp. 1XD8-33]|uniref:spore cortex-lytic enzyme n=1 Tax=Acutalibacter sp. 1XD8-33 TaxID=2320081 RepID=UPI000EA19E78|nr:spore cortex-lytic enzyme [Acutalibacter sp. 1XD8-33]RKJ39389.1 spore cortex-lytic enzyme [Acutalibacter sp. 1XD8-33]
MRIQKKKAFLFAWRIMVITLVNIMILVMLLDSGGAQALSKYGSTGSEVTQIQQRLTELGYNPGTVDGIYGTRTKNAVISFQRDYGLSDDGIVGPLTLEALGLSGGGGSGGGSYGGFSESDVQLLATIISAEARGEPYQGQVAVGAVIMNRIAHPSFPNTLSGVIYQQGAFSCLTDGGVNAPVADSAYTAARESINGSDPTGGAIYYYNPAKTTNKWIWSRQVVAVIGAHRFAI